MQTNKRPYDYEHNHAIVSHPQRLCTSCGGRVFPDPRTSKMTCASCKGLDWEWVQEADSAAYRAGKESAHVTWTAYAPSAEELEARSYKGLHSPRLCPHCDIRLTVNEKQILTIDKDRPHYQRRLTCPNWFVTGCKYTEPWSDEIRDELIAEAKKLESIEVDF